MKKVLVAVAAGALLLSAVSFAEETMTTQDAYVAGSSAMDGKTAIDLAALNQPMKIKIALFVNGHQKGSHEFTAEELRGKTTLTLGEIANKIGGFKTALAGKQSKHVGIAIEDIAFGTSLAGERGQKLGAVRLARGKNMLLTIDEIGNGVTLAAKCDSNNCVVEKKK